jgi:hypothetical protein
MQCVIFSITVGYFSTAQCTLVFVDPKLYSKNLQGMEADGIFFTLSTPKQEKEIMILGIDATTISLSRRRGCVFIHVSVSIGK